MKHKDNYFVPEHDNQVQHWNNNKQNFDDYSDRSDGNYNRSEDVIKIKEWLHNTDWKKEADYHNSYHRNKNTKKSANWDAAFNNCMSKRANEPEGIISNPHAHASQWELSSIGKEYYAQEIKNASTIKLNNNK